jgi:hypothetical protein
MLVDHAQRGVSGAGQLGRGLDDPLEDGVDRELGRHRDSGVEKRSESVLLSLLHAAIVRPPDPERPERRNVARWFPNHAMSRCLKANDDRRTLEWQLHSRSCGTGLEQAMGDGTAETDDLEQAARRA